MKISKDTIDILKNFSTINPSIVVHENTNVLKTMSPQKTIIGSAEIEQFPKTFGIYNLNEFLASLSLFNEPELTFKDNLVEIKSNNSTVKYVYSSVDTIIQAPEKNLELPDAVVEFDLTQENFNSIMKAASVLGLPHMKVVNDGSELYIEVTDIKNPSENSFKLIVEGESNTPTEIVFKIDNLKFIAGDYHVVLSSKGISHFKSDKAEYYIATEVS